MRLKILAALILLITFTFSGCFPSGEKSPDTSKVVTEDKTFEYNAPHINVSFEIPQIQNDLPTRIKLKEKSFDTDKMLKLFFYGKTILPERTWEGNFYTDDDSFLCVGSNSLSFYEGKTAPLKKFQIDAPLNYQAVLCVNEEYFRALYNIGEELEGFPSETALDRANELISTLGITTLGEPEIYAFSVDTLKKLKEINFSFAFNEKYPLTKDNEVYVLKFRQAFNGIELADVNASIKDNTDELKSFMISSPNVTVGVSKDKIFYFDAGEVYEKECAVLNSDTPKYDLNYALSELRNYLEKSRFFVQTVIDKAKLVYFPIERNEEGYVEYSLAWSFEGYVGSKVEGDVMKNDYKKIVLCENGICLDFGG